MTVDPPPALREKWACPGLTKETDADFRKLYLKRVGRPQRSSSEDPCDRLYHTPTLSALRRFNAEDRPPPDSLDLWLGSMCDQFVDWPISKAEAVRQPITCYDRCLCRPVPSVTERQFDHPLRIAPFCETPTNINSVKLAIECPHTSQTNNGYSRKNENGNFYRS
ncbi:hypothetical protein AVEN_99839-1 [Araneus ventricosus]|uniref:Uncharacterized protein n=1 Tax=Araneus ventricosus TaxID=182803 RepID=A0A4Y2MX30_ARAVE|nr:hypothetical protein AVEN_99839-1 [Araneus ventricosus]